MTSSAPLGSRAGFLFLGWRNCDINETMDWGELTHLYRMCPKTVREKVAMRLDITPSQLTSWLKCLNILRNKSAHNARMFNSVYVLTPKLPNSAIFSQIKGIKGKIFEQISLIEYIIKWLNLDKIHLLPKVLQTYPDDNLVPFEVTGAPSNWRTLELWK